MGEKAHKGYLGKGMEGFFATFYDRNAKDYMQDQYKIWVAALKKILPAEAKILELAPGPGYLSIELAKTGITSVTGLDISHSFMEIAARNAEQAGVKIDFIQGNASALPFPASAFTHIICTSAFKNFSEPLAALEEMYRVLVPGGIVWMSDMRHDVSDREIDKYVREMMKLKGLNAVMTSMTFKNMLRKRAYTKESMLELVAKTQFGVLDFAQYPMEFNITLRKGKAL